MDEWMNGSLSGWGWCVSTLSFRRALDRRDNGSSSRRAERTYGVGWWFWPTTTSDVPAWCIHQTRLACPLAVWQQSIGLRTQHRGRSLVHTSAGSLVSWWISSCSHPLLPSDSLDTLVLIQFPRSWVCILATEDVTRNGQFSGVTSRAETLIDWPCSFLMIIVVAMDLPLDLTCFHNKGRNWQAAPSYQGMIQQPHQSSSISEWAIGLPGRTYHRHNSNEKSDSCLYVEHTREDNGCIW